MPYWKSDETRTDVNGTPIRPGDVLQSTDPYPLEEWFVCYTDDGYHIEVRDLNANNVCICDLGPEGNVVNRGHFLKNLNVLNDEDLQYYFGLDVRKLRHNRTLFTDEHRLVDAE